MGTVSRMLVTGVLTLWFTASVVAHSPVEFLEVLEVKPSLPVEHAVDLKSKLDADRLGTNLHGPAFFARAVGAMNRTVKRQRAYLNWFKITDTQTSPIRDVEILDIVRGNGNKQLRIGSAEFFLSPSQLITSGAPDAIPSGLDHYKAYRVVDSASLNLEIELAETVSTSKRRVGRPIFVCLPVKEWHHAEFFDASHPNDCFVVYELDEQATSQQFTTIDQFGLNELKSSKNRWLCARGAVLKLGK